MFSSRGWCQHISFPPQHSLLCIRILYEHLIRWNFRVTQVWNDQRSWAVWREALVYPRGQSDASLHDIQPLVQPVYVLPKLDHTETQPVHTVKSFPLLHFCRPCFLSKFFSLTRTWTWCFALRYFQCAYSGGLAYFCFHSVFKRQ